jgi:flagellar FliJ protein
VKKFQFRLQPLLKLKSHRERERQKDLATALEKVHSQKSRLSDIDSRRLETLEFQRHRLEGTLSTASLQACSRYLVRLKADTLAGREVLSGLEQQAEERRTLLVEAARQRKMYERLKERQQHKYYAEMNRAENKELDEIALQAHRRRREN